MIYTECIICKTIRKYHCDTFEYLVGEYTGSSIIVRRSNLVSRNCCLTKIKTEYEKELSKKDTDIIKLLYEK